MSETPEVRVAPAWLRLAPLLLGTVLALLFGLAHAPAEKTRFDQLALGKETTSHYATLEGQSIHCEVPGTEPPCPTLSESEAAILWLGNSQLHGINQFGSGDQNAVGYLGTQLARHGQRLLAYSQPNANLQEHLALLSHLQHQTPVKALLLPLVFDDFREDGLRTDIAALLGDTATREALATSAIGARLLDRYGAVATEDADQAALRGTVQARVESALEDGLSAHWPLWALREEFRGEVLTFLYRLRNSLFGIRPDSKRQIIASAYAANMAALAAIIQQAGELGIPVLLYIVPLRQDVDPPYVADQYAAFKHQIKQLSSEYSGTATLLNLETLVPARYWGLKDATHFDGEPELDFMHFKASGHRLLAEALYGPLMALRQGGGH